MKTIESDGMFAVNIPDDLSPEKLKLVEELLTTLNKLFTVKPEKNEKRKRITAVKK